jgi:hypothetical protein
MASHPWMNQYSVLTEVHRADPVDSLEEIVGRHHLFNQRDNLFEFYRAALQSEAWKDDDWHAKSDHLFFYSTTLYLWEIAFRIVEMIESKDLIFYYKGEKLPPSPEMQEKDKKIAELAKENKKHGELSRDLLNQLKHASERDKKYLDLQVEFAQLQVKHSALLADIQMQKANEHKKTVEDHLKQVDQTMQDLSISPKRS